MESKQLILLGPPGVNVGAHAIALSERWHVPHVSLGTLLSRAGHAAGLGADHCIQANQSVPDALAIKLMRKRFEQPDVMLKGWVVDEFPRTLSQAQAFDRWLLSVGHGAAQVVYLKAMTGLLLKRLSAEQGPEQPISAIRRQLQQHQAEVAPLLEYYRQQGQLTTINASQSVTEINYTLSQLVKEKTGAARFIQDESELDSLLAKESLLVVDCMASWCGSCKLVTPLIDKLAEAYCDRANVMKIDFDANKQIHKRFGLKGMPAVMIFKDGKLLETLTGVKPYQAYTAAVSRCLG